MDSEPRLARAQSSAARNIVQEHPSTQWHPRMERTQAMDGQENSQEAKIQEARCNKNSEEKTSIQIRDYLRYPRSRE